MKRLIWLAATAIALTVPPIASASDGYVTGSFDLRSGPDVDYPAVYRIRAGTRINVEGCTNRWEWCDVVSYGNRGWIPGGYIQLDYQNQRVLLPSYGERIGIPIITFSINTYWNSYYRNRPFYRDHDRWYSRRIEYRPAPRPVYYRPSRWHDHHGSPPPRVVPLPRPIHGPPVPHPIDPGNRPPPYHRAPNDRGDRAHRPANRDGRGDRKPEDRADHNHH